MDDLISRQAAIDALRVAYWDDNIQSAKDDPCIVDAMTDWAIRQVKALPPAQPESLVNESRPLVKDTISRQSAIDAIDEYMVGKNCATDGTMMARLINELVIKRLPSATDKNVGTKLGTNLAEVGTDCISREQAIDAVRATLLSWSYMPEWRDNKIIEAVEQLPSVQLDTYWKEQCQSYEQTINKLRESLSTQPKIKQQAINSSDCIDRQAALDALRKMQTYKLFSGDDMLLIDQAGAQTELMLLPPAQPKSGQWILDRSGAYCCSECMEPCAGYVMMRPRDKFCKMCGSRNEVTE